MKNKIVLGLVGEIGSGKGTVVKYLKEKYGASSYRFSDSIRDVLKRLHLEDSRKNMQDLSFILRKTFGQDLFAEVISKDARNDKNKIVVVDGIRRPEDIKLLEKVPGFKLVYITADIRTRFDRIKKRGENSDDIKKTFEQFAKDHTAETEIYIPVIGEKANYKIDNTGAKQKLIEEIEKIIELSKQDGK